MRPRTAHRLSLFFGLCLFAISLYGQMGAALHPCGGLAHNYQPIIAFELARSLADLGAIFGDGPSVCRDTITVQMNLLNTVDNFVYIPLYTLFLVFFFAGLWRRDSLLAKIGLGLAAIAALADYGENACLFRIALDPDAESFALDNLWWITGVKWLGLALAGFSGGLILGGRGSLLTYAAFFLCAAGLVVTGTALTYPHAWGPLIANGILASWVVFLIVDIRESFRREGQPA